MLALAAGENRAAAQCFRQSLEMDPSSSESAAYLAYADYLAAPAKHEAAASSKAELRRLAARGDSDAATAHLLIARIHRCEGNLDLSATELALALSLDPDLADARAEWSSLPEEIRGPVPPVPEEAADIPRETVSLTRFFAGIWLALITLGGFSFAAALLLSEALSLKAVPIGAEDFRDILPLERIRLGEKRLEAVVVGAAEMGAEERRRRIEVLCRRLDEKGFILGLLTDEKDQLVGKCEKGVLVSLGP